MKKVYLLIVFLLITPVFIKAECLKSAYEIIFSSFRISPRPIFEKNQVKDDPRVKIFPNPTHDNFKIEIELDKNSEVEIIIYNAIGKSIFAIKETAPSGTYTKSILFDEQPSGIYFVNIKSGDIKSVERLIKMK